MNAEQLLRPCTAFDRARLLVAGPLVEVALAVRAASEHEDPGTPGTRILVFDDATGQVLDLDLRGSSTEIVERLARPPQTRERSRRGRSGGATAVDERPQSPSGSDSDRATVRRGRGRPRLGVVGREVTLLPRHWDWLAAQPGGASVTLRRLVEDARRASGDGDRARRAREAAYHVMSVLGGDLPGYEEAIRALFADDRPGVVRHTRTWPTDVREYALRLAFPGDRKLPKEHD